MVQHGALAGAAVRSTVEPVGSGSVMAWHGTVQLGVAAGLVVVAVVLREHRVVRAT